jgi:tetratricopeptide (TPR) repeat protein
VSTRAALLLLAGALLAGCAAEPAGSEWFLSVQAASEQADRLEAAGDAAGARAALEEALSRPASGVHPGDARALRQDLLFRAGCLELASGRHDAARAQAEQGLALGRVQDVFTANLLILRGRALEAAGDARAAGRDYHDALVINEALLDAALGGKGQQ